MKTTNGQRKINEKLLNIIAEQQAQVSAVQAQSAEDKEKIAIINEIEKYLSLENFKADETFEIPGVQLKNGNFIKIYVKEEDITKIADKAEKYEKLLGIKFPAQVYQYQSKYIGETIPGTKTPIPRPKLMSETNRDYEEYLETIYANEGIFARTAPDKIGRQPYPHEHINFKKTNEMDSSYYSEYYMNYQSRIRGEALRNQTPQPTEPKKGNNRINSGEKLTVKDSELVEKTLLGQKIGQGLTTAGITASNPNFWTKFKLIIAGVVIATPIGIFAYLNPSIAAGLAVGTIFVGGGIFLRRKIKEWASRKINDLLYGKPLEATEDNEESKDLENIISQNYNNEKEEPQKEEPSKEEPQIRKPTKPQEDNTKIYTPREPKIFDPTTIQAYNSNKETTIAPQENNAIPGYDGFISEIAQASKGLRDIDSRIEVEKNRKNNYPPDTPEYQSIDNSLLVLEQQKERLLTITETLISDFSASGEIKQGGKAL